MGQALAKKRRKKWTTQIAASETHRRQASVTLPDMPWDRGADGPANRIGLVEEPRGEVDEKTGKVRNPNGVKGVRRRLWVETYWQQGKLTRGQLNVARELLDAHEGRKAQDPLAAIKIDRQTGKPDPQAAAFDKRRKFHAMWAVVPLFARPVIEHVVINNRPLRAMAGCSSARSAERHLERLRRGLDMLRE